MKKIALLAGLTLAVVAIIPGAASAHSYDYEKGSRKTSHTAKWQGRKQTNKHNKKYQAPVKGTIVDTLVEKGKFTTLVTAVQAAGLAGTLSAPGDLTVFAPTDRAFAKLPAGTIEALLADKAMLTTVLTNHVVAGRVDGATAIRVGEAKALSGNTLNIGYGNDGKLYINDSRITMTDIHTSNGIIHVIDAVLVP